MFRLTTVRGSGLFCNWLRSSANSSFGGVWGQEVAALQSGLLDAPLSTGERLFLIRSTIDRRFSLEVSEEPLLRLLGRIVALLGSADWSAGCCWSDAMSEGGAGAGSSLIVCKMKTN